MMRNRLILRLLALAVFSPSLTHAAHFDFIYADQVTMRAPLAGWGISLGSNSFGLIVNKGPSTLSVEELNAADFDVDGVPEWPDTTTIPINPRMDAEMVNAHYVGPLPTNHAAGSVGSHLGDVLLPLLDAGETLHNIWPGSCVWFQMDGSGNSSGVVRFDLHLTIGEESVSFPIFVTLIESTEHSIEFTHATRITSSPLVATPAQPTTWGKVKGLYRQ